MYEGCNIAVQTRRKASRVYMVRSYEKAEMTRWHSSSQMRFRVVRV